MGLAGVPFDCYEIHDLAHENFPGDQYKLLIFVNCAKVSDQPACVTDLISGEVWEKTERLNFSLPAYRTRLFRQAISREILTADKRQKRG